MNGGETLAVAFVGSTDGVVRRLPEVLADAGGELSVVGPPASVLASSRHATRVVEVGSGDDRMAFLDGLVQDPDLLASLPRWIVWASDSDLRQLARSSLDLDMKVRVLPARTPAGLTMLGSKAGLADLTATLGVSRPKSTVVTSAMELAAGLAAVPGRVLIKADEGGGGTRILDVADTHVADHPVLPDEWYPVVVQEFVDGAEISVEALFGDGRLLGWLYSHPTRLEGWLGRSTVREYRDPPRQDFVETLQQLAHAAGLHGFANCTFIRTADDHHLLVEVDMRPNAWHQFGPQLGVDWRALMLDVDSGDRPPVHPAIGHGRVRRLHLFPRELVHALTAPSVGALLPWLFRDAGTWQTRNHADPAMNRVELRVILYTASRLPLAVIRRLRRR